MSAAPASAAERLAQARALVDAGDLDGASAICAELLAAHPGHAAAHHLLGFIELGRERPGDAVRAFEAALHLGADTPDLHLNLGYALIAQGRSAEAVGPYRTAAAKAPGWPAALLGLGVALQESGELESAAESFEQALACAPDDPDVLINLGAVRTRLGRHVRAIECLERAVDSLPGDAEAHRRLGDARAAGSDWRRAAASYETAADLEPESAAAHRGLAHALERLGDGQGAVDAYQRAIGIDPGDVDALAALGELLREAGRTAEALECLHRAVALRPRDEALTRALRGAQSQRIAAWHWPMIADETRNDAYRRAIERAVDSSSVVLDIGTGSGLLAMMAARAGARRVYACEMSTPLAEVAREVVRRNGFADRITVINAPSTALAVGAGLDEPATVLVSEIVDVGLLAEGVLPSVRHAVAHLLAPAATVIPARATVHARLVEVPGLRAVNPVRTIAGFDLSALDELRDPDAYLDVDLSRHEHRSLSDDVEIGRFDLARPQPAGEPEIRTLVVTARQAGLVHAVALWFELHLDDAVTIDTRPGGPVSAWGQALHFLDADVPARAGESLVLRARIADTRIDLTLGRAS